MRDTVFGAITTKGDDETVPGTEYRQTVTNRAVALKAVLPEAGEDLTPGELRLLSEWLDRLSYNELQGRFLAGSVTGECRWIGKSVCAAGQEVLEAKTRTSPPPGQRGAGKAVTRIRFQQAQREG